jgi:di/tricarboxylate transporter
MNFISFFLFGLLVGILLTWIFELIIKTNKKLHHRYYKQHETIFGYHVHHSVYGLIFLLVSIIYILNQQIESSILTAGMGVGVILEHTVSERRFVFVNKWKRR